MLIALAPCGNIMFHFAVSSKKRSPLACVQHAVCLAFMPGRGKRTK
jgi:hypothetical protein